MMRRLMHNVSRAIRRKRGMSQVRFERKRDRLLKRSPPPTCWMLGKTGSGKSSIIRFVTGAEDVQIGRGFKPTTRTTSVYEFPDAALPMMRFLDTRGLAETDYDPAEDIAVFAQATHAIIVTQKLTDFAVEPVVRPLQSIRRQAPERPVLLVLTCLHEAYPQRQHPPYPFLEAAESPTALEPVRRCITQHLAHFTKLYDAVVPVDLTRPEDGFEEPSYGGAHLQETLVGLLPAAYRQAFRDAADVVGQLRDLRQRRAMTYVFGAAQLASASAFAPVPWVDIPFLVAVQTRMVYAIARIYNQTSTVKQVLELLAVGGAGFSVRMGVRELFKLVPYVGTITGGVLGGAMAFSYTYALGRVCCWYYSAVLDGHQPHSSEIQAALREHWDEGQRVWQRRQGASRPRQ